MYRIHLPTTKISWSTRSFCQRFEEHRLRGRETKLSASKDKEHAFDLSLIFYYAAPLNDLCRLLTISTARAKIVENV